MEEDKEMVSQNKRMMLEKVRNKVEEKEFEIKNLKQKMRELGTKSAERKRLSNVIYGDDLSPIQPMRDLIMEDHPQLSHLNKLHTDIANLKNIIAAKVITIHTILSFF
jgi:hypothetical protein